MIEDLPEDLLNNLNKSSAWNHPAGKRTNQLIADFHTLPKYYWNLPGFMNGLIYTLAGYSLTLEDVDLDGKFLGKSGMITYYLIKDSKHVGGISIWYEKHSKGYYVSPDLEYDYS